MEAAHDVRPAAALVRAAGPRGVVALTGAGVSTGSGIPDYRGPQGLWTTRPSTRDATRAGAEASDAALRREAWARRARHPAWRARPNAAHRALAALERRGLLGAVVTQNVDGLHWGVGHRVAVVELHGSVHRTRCTRCDERRPTREALARVAAQPDPPCLRCGGPLTSDTVKFGERLDERVLLRAQEAVRGCSVLLAAGSSLLVHPAAALCDVARRAGARLVVANAQATPYDDHADVVLRGDLVEVLPALVPRAVPGAVPASEPPGRLTR